MPAPKPIYTPHNCEPSFKLYWTLSVFWRAEPIPSEHWLDALRPLTERDGVRILEYRLKDTGASQFLISTRPECSPSNAVRSVKGRLQHEIRARVPKAFKQNYSIKSVGSAKLDAVQHYVDSQLDHHPMADPAVQAKLTAYQIDHPEADLVRPRRSAHGEFLCNLHLVFVHAGRWCEIRDGRLIRSRDMIERTAAKKGHRLSKARLLPDHVHLTLGCDVTESPMDVALGYMNNLAYAHGMVPLLQNGFYIGTFGEYDLGAIRLAGNRRSAGASPAAAGHHADRVLAGNRRATGTSPAEA